MIGKTISHYKILEKLGGGGMGVVYKAQDIKLDRFVALKFLPPHLQAEEEKKRFIHEAKAASALDHPNICTVYDIKETDDDQLYIVMACYDGESLKDRIERGALPIGNAVEIGTQIAQGLAKAHEQGIVHRDLKPANVMITKDGVVKIVDFGLAKLRGQTKLTKSGTTLGTTAYMSPEQATGHEVDHRTDIFSFGVLFHEMLSGEQPFEGDYEQAVIYSILNEDPNPLSNEVPEELRNLIFRALDKDIEKRVQSADEVLQSLKELQGEKGRLVVKAFDLKSIVTLLRRPRNALVAVGIFLLLAAAIFFPYRNLLRVQSAREKLSEIENLAQSDSYFEAYQLAVGAEKLLNNDSTLARLMPIISDKLTITTQPAGAKIYLKRFAPKKTGQSPKGEYIGETPIEDLRIGRSDYKITIEKEDYVPVERIASSALNRNEASFGVLPDIKFEVRLHKIQEAPENMVFIPGGDYRLVSSAAPTDVEVHLDDYFMDRFEVSNKEYKAFIKAGGYLQEKFWKNPLMGNGQRVSRQEAMRRFRDRTGLSGPRNWVNQEYPEGKANHPVTDITWYEASAYAEFAGKSLPTIFQWEKAARDGAITHFVGRVMPWGLVSANETSEHRANFQGRETTSVDSYEFGLSPYGCYNMAGNVKEWCFNEMTDGFAATSGSWQEPDYLFYSIGTLPGFYSSGALGFRCVKTMGDIRDQGAIRINIDTSTPSYSAVNEAKFEAFLGYYKYDKRPLDAEVVETIETEDWKREKVTFAGLGGDRIIVYVYLPKRAKSPFQCINLIPGSDIFYARGAAEYAEWLLAPQIKAGRAVMALVPKGAVERPWGRDYVSPKIHTVGYRDRAVLWAIEYRLGLDYLATRTDIDMDRIAHLGFSWGAASFGIVYTAIEERYSSVIFIGGGFHPSYMQILPEANPINFASRIKPPKLMLHGRYDEELPYKKEALPFFNLMTEPKRLELVDGGHMPPLEIRAPIINSWLDETLEPVKFE